ncbi:MAG: helix-turn-helix domain-containing protein [Clostridia bacterium]|nr:helix-turn-helix domain-containing protein [Clostridia bacterium]
MKTDSEWLSENFRRRELSQSHNSMESEFSFYQAVSNGDIESVRKACDEYSFAKVTETSILSESSLQNARYHFIITAALVTRFCVEGGMELEQAYGLSDYYIRKMDKMSTPAEIIGLHRKMVFDYTEKMGRLARPSGLSKAVRVSVDYIFLNLHKRITLEELAENAGVSAGHLSRLFRSELGMSAGDYIREKKLDSAKELLKYSDLSLVDIASALSFASQSYFISVFKKHEGITPNRYRESFSKYNRSYIKK